MDTGNGTRGDGRLLTAALLVLTGTMAAAFGRVFEGRAPAVRLVGAAAAAVLIGALLQRRHLALSVGAALAGLGVAVGILVFPRTTALGVLPTGETLDALTRAASNLGRRAVEETAPAPPLPALFAPALVAVWAASTAAHALAVRAASPILALIPPAALLGFANVVAEDGARLGYAAAFLIASLLVLFTSGVVRLRTWGPLLPPRRDAVAVLQVATGPSGRLARRLAAGATLAAVLVPGLLPGFRAGAVLDLEGTIGERVSISPLVDIRPNLVRNPALELFTVQADRAAYWRLQALDEYTGRFWRSSDRRGQARTPSVGSLGYLDPAIGRRRGSPLVQRFELRRLGGSILPAAYLPVEVDTTDLRVLHDLDRTVLAAADGIPEGRATYGVRSVVPSPTAEDLDRPFDFDGTDPRYRALPDRTPPEVRGVAEELTRGVTTPFRRALAIQNYLRGFTYDLDVAVGHGFEDILAFLQVRRGYCQQFAATMAVLLRSLGYPARVAVGFLPGTRDDDGVFRVTTEQAHAWTEMFFPGYGWLAFEPTPTRENPAARYLQGPAAFPAFPGTAQGEVGQVGIENPARDAAFAGDLSRRFGELSGLKALQPEERDPGWPRWLRIATIGGGLLLLLMAGIPARKWLRRRRRLWRAGSPRELVLAAYDVLDDRALDLGLHRGLHETPREYAIRLRDTVRLSDGHLERLTDLTVLAAYTRREVSPAEGTDAVRATRRLGTDLRRHMGRGRSLLSALRPFPPD